MNKPATQKSASVSESKASNLRKAIELVFKQKADKTSLTLAYSSDD